MPEHTTEMIRERFIITPSPHVGGQSVRLVDMLNGRVYPFASTREARIAAAMLISGKHRFGWL